MGQYIIEFTNIIWGLPLLILLIGGGIFFFIYSGLAPFRYLKHAFRILIGKYDDPDDPGDINHYEALSTALASTIGMGNISGVAIAIATGGPGAIFWMWISAFFGMATKFFSCSLAVMYRRKDENNELQGGPMYVITEGLGNNWRPLAIFFSLAGMIGVLPLFQVNQFTQAIRDIFLVPSGIDNVVGINVFMGLSLAAISALVIFGGIKRIGKVVGKLVPIMIAVYFMVVILILVLNAADIIPAFRSIFADAFTGNALLGGALGQLIITGVRRGTFSNEAGIGTAPMAHSAAKTNEPIREGLVAMMGPAIDTLLVCTLTALALIITGVWINPDTDGITLTATAFEKALPGAGTYILMVCVLFFALTTLFAFPYYGTKCFAFVFGAKYKKLYNYIYLIGIFVSAITSLNVLISFVDGVYALMAIPTMTSTLLLAPRVRKEFKKYFSKIKSH
ncbi:MAG: alanine/glycine:cation symporter family protein [Cyclobacteriaceae bacterium]